jgi:hypothetical protein
MSGAKQQQLHHAFLVAACQQSLQLAVERATVCTVQVTFAASK